MQPDFQVSDDPAGRVAALLVEATGHVVLTGGSTPRRAYERAAEERADWSGVDVWFTDERCVAPDHEGANAYERELAESGPADATFDLMFVGLGADSHICSLFPNDDALGERERPVVGVETPGMAPLLSRITLTLPVVNRTRQVVFLVTGEEKALAAARAFSGRPDPRYPGSLVEGPVTVLLDPPAAAQL